MGTGGQEASPLGRLLCGHTGWRCGFSLDTRCYCRRRYILSLNSEVLTAPQRSTLRRLFRDQTSVEQTSSSQQPAISLNTLETWLQNLNQPCIYLRTLCWPSDSALRLAIPLEETPQQILDEQAQKMQESLRGALQEWARTTGEGTDYRDNLPLQCMHPVGHWYEIPNLLRNGFSLAYLMSIPIWNTFWSTISILGTDLSPSLLVHTFSQETTSPSKSSDATLRTGWRSRQDQWTKPHHRGLAMPHEECGLICPGTIHSRTGLAYLVCFGSSSSKNRSLNEDRVALAIRKASDRMPTYVTLKT